MPEVVSWYLLSLTLDDIANSCSCLVVSTLLMFSADFVAADDHETDYEFGVGSDDDDQIGDGEPRYKQLLIMNNFVK